MATRIGSPLVLLLLAAGLGFGQIGFPGQYPPNSYPGQYPPNQGGISLPGGRSTTRPAPDNRVSTQTLTGMLRRISNADLVIESDDKVIITVSLGDATKYYDSSSNVNSSTGNSPKAARRTDFQPGDQLTVEATQDDERYYHATKVTLGKHGTAEDRAKALRPVDSWPDNDQDQKAASNRSATTASRDSDDSYRPSLQRGSPAGSGPDSQAPAASDPRPSIQAQEVNGVTRLPDAPQIDRSEPVLRAAPRSQDFDGDPVIEKAREAAFSFIETLPNYVVKQVTTRFATEAAHGGHTSWQPIDNVTADVVSDGGTEKYKNILVNGKPPKDSIEKTGSWSTGEYASVLQDILSTDTNADFRNKRPSTIVNRAAFHYDFTVAQQNSHWHVFSSAESYVPEFTGSIWIDKESYRVLRIELSAHSFPARFPLDTVESATDYDFVLIGGSKYLLPVHSEALSCVRGTGACSRNVIDFRNYRKFSADTSITFEPDK